MSRESAPLDEALAASRSLQVGLLPARGSRGGPDGRSFESVRSIGRDMRGFEFVRSIGDAVRAGGGTSPLAARNASFSRQLGLVP